MESNSVDRTSKLKEFLDTYMFYVLINKNHRQCATNRMKMALNMESNGAQFSHS